MTVDILPGLTVKGSGRAYVLRRVSAPYPDSGTSGSAGLSGPDCLVCGDRGGDFAGEVSSSSPTSSVVEERNGVVAQPDKRRSCTFGRSAMVRRKIGPHIPAPEEEFYGPFSINIRNWPLDEFFPSRTGIWTRGIRSWADDVWLLSSAMFAGSRSFCLKSCRRGAFFVRPVSMTIPVKILENNNPLFR